MLSRISNLKNTPLNMLKILSTQKQQVIKTFSTTTLPSDTNQAKGIAQYAIDFMQSDNEDKISPSVFERTQMFHTDAVLAGVSAIAYQTNAPTVLRNEALQYTDKNGSFVFGSNVPVATEKAICANSSAMREWDCNGTVFGYNKNIPNHQAGEFGHNDYYPVATAAAQANKNINGKKTLKGMICIDEIRGRMSEVFSLKTYKIDHVVHGGVAAAAVYGAMMGATAEQIESAIGMLIAHYIPYRAIRAGKQLSDSKGASAAITSEAAILSVKRAMNGFKGPQDIFRNPEALFCLNEKPSKAGNSPFNIVLTNEGDDFAVMGMHFKLGIYEHQSAAAIEATIQLLANYPDIYDKGNNIKNVQITAYEPAFGIIGDPNKRTPTTRQSADHSMVFIISRLLTKAFQNKQHRTSDTNSIWKQLILLPEDYSQKSIFDKATRNLMEKVFFVHGGPTYDALYPDGIPTTVDITFDDNTTYTSGLIMYPCGHARNTTADFKNIIQNKFKTYAELAMPSEDAKNFTQKLQNMEFATPQEVQEIYNHPKLSMKKSVDETN